LHYATNVPGPPIGLTRGQPLKRPAGVKAAAQPSAIRQPPGGTPRDIPWMGHARTTGLGHHAPATAARGPCPGAMGQKGAET
ncbi:hypothetical protein RZS08_59130, partial [Arthrospira platensis SPKY1]|nr:hypothetical protein [Arthrospira platensis SPKY1]